MVTEPLTDSPAAGGESVLREMRALARYFGRQRWIACVVVVLGLAAALAEAASIAVVVMFMFTLLGQDQQADAVEAPLGRLYAHVESLVDGDARLIAAALLGLILLNATIVYANNVLQAVILNRVAERMRDLIHDRFVHVGYAYLQRRDQGDLVQTLSTESWTAAEAFLSLARIVVNLCAVAILGAGLFALSWIIGLTVVAGAGASFALLRQISRPVKRLGQKLLQANQVLADRMLVALHGMRTLRVFALESYALRAFGSASSRVRRLVIRKETVQSFAEPISRMSGLGTLILIVVVAGRSGVDLPTIVASLLLLFRLQPYLQQAEAHRVALAGMAASLADVRRTLDRHDKPWPRQGWRRFEGLERELRFENVTFAHGRHQKACIEGQSFTIRAGQTTILAGPSGSGKTTVLNLILRLYEPESGRITADGEDIAEFTRESWLHKFSLAGQDIELLAGSILQNIRFGRARATQAEVEEVCDLVEILDDLKALPNGLHTRVDAAGLNFSGGQRQRLGLARALLSNPDILLLDEAMSAIEPDREDRIRRRIAARLAGRTIIVVSHRIVEPRFDEDLVRIG
jgi:ATP-binding cassette, subfamily B, bacterial MsbA